MKKTFLKGAFLVYGTFVAIDMFLKIREGKPILQAFLESAMIPIHVAGTTVQLLLAPQKWPAAITILSQMVNDLFDPAASPAQDVETGYDALVMLIRGEPDTTKPDTGEQRPVNNPEIVQQTDVQTSDPLYRGIGL